MCEQCSTDSLDIGEVVPGLFLFQARKNGRHMKAGDYGLVRSNDPDVTWSFRPEPDPYEGMSDEEINSQDGKAWEAWRPLVQEFAAQCKAQLDMTKGLRIALLCQAAGYNHNKDGLLEYWLFHRMGVLMKAKEAA